MKTYIITGATSGLGLSIAKSLAKDKENQVVFAVRDVVRGKILADTCGVNCSVMPLDLCSMRSVDDFIASWRGSIAGLINNAGVQIVGDTRFTDDELEETFVVNHLAALKLTQGLLPYMHLGRVLFIGSGTHNPKSITARLFGFRGARFESIEQCAKGSGNGGSKGDSSRRLGMDRYATSKFLNMVTTIEFSRRVSGTKVSFFCLDPGLMAGTGLARSAPLLVQFLWVNILPWLAKALPDTSTAERSGHAAAWIMTSAELEEKTGVVFSYDCKPAKNVWSRVYGAELGQSVMDDSMNLLSTDSVTLVV
ncbi:hypothetical protein A9Q99_01015 [Gammaproteobacteria bacterium 45_16_T64]|nr:hypothetical protein A9Q99_01015 [Gammaproteobacteria bacterium 45_16_T64]